MHYNFCLKPCTNHFQTTHDILVKPSLDERDLENSVTASKFIITFTYMSTYYSIQFVLCAQLYNLCGTKVDI